MKTNTDTPPETTTKNHAADGVGLDAATCSAFLDQAQKNLKKWGKQDLFTLGLAVSEETGELCQAILKERDEGGDRERIRAEATDLAALCHQIIYYLGNPPCAICDHGDYQVGHSKFCPQNSIRLSIFDHSTD